MAKNEAKIKFNADTRAFTDSIQKAESSLQVLRAELKLNDAKMQATGTTVEGLQKKHDILSDQLAAQKGKVEALSGKLDAAVRIYGENSSEADKWRTKLLNAQAAEAKLEQAVQQCSAELEEQKTASSTAEGATESLTGKVSRQEAELKKLKEAYVEAVAKYGSTSDEAKKLGGEIADLSGKLKQSKTTLNDASKEADRLDQSMEGAGDSARNSEDGFTIAKGAIANLASEAIQFAIGKVSEFVGWLAELPEATRELRQDMATLETSFETAGFTTEQATGLWKELYTVFGEDDRAVEASNLIAKMSSNQKDLNDWVTITTGIFGTYQDSLPVEGLAEASMETAKTGQVTGVLADALNWSSEAAEMFAGYMSEDVTTAEDAFNEALKECTTEEERQALITETLTALYGDAAAKYEEASGQQLAAKEATAENTLAQAELAEAIEPVTTAWDGLKAQLLTAMIPAVEKVSGAMLGAMNWLKEHPVALQVIAAVVGVLAVALTALTAVVIAQTVAQWAMNAAWLANPITWIVIGIVAAIAALAAIFVLLWNNCEGFRNFFIDMWGKIKAVWAECQPYFEVIGNAIKTVFSIVKDFLVARFKLAWEGIKLAWSVAVSWFKVVWEGIKATFSVVKTYLSGMFRTAWVAIQAIWSAATGYFKAIWNTIKGVFAVVKSVLSGDFQGAWDAIKGIVNTWKGYFSNVWSGIKAVFASVKSWFTSTFSAAWSGVKNVWSAVGGFFGEVVSKVKSTFSKVKEIIAEPFRTALDKVKGFFANLKLKFPSIKLPHFSITGKFSLSPPSVPKLSIEWYKDGGIMMKPTIFGMNGNSLMAGGEAGPEAILPINRLEGYISGAIEKAQNVVNLQSVADAIEDLANRPIKLNVNGREIAIATAGDFDSVNGLRTTFSDRGLVLG